MPRRMVPHAWWPHAPYRSPVTSRLMRRERLTGPGRTGDLATISGEKLVKMGCEQRGIRELPALPQKEAGRWQCAQGRDRLGGHRATGVRHHAPGVTAITGNSAESVYCYK
jgi:hypothetical protein